MSRQAVGAIVAVLAASIVMQLIAHAGAIPESALHASLVVISWLVKLGVVVALAFFVAQTVVRGPIALAAHAAAVLGALGMVAALLLGAPTVWEAIAFAWLVAGLFAGRRVEKRALSRRFPEYRANAARAPRLGPGRVPARPLAAGVDLHRIAAAGALALGIATVLASHAALAAGAG